MSTWAAVAVAAVFVWLGMVLAISFVEAPIKFRAPEVTLRIGLGIGRLVFRALNAIEAVFAVVVLAAALFGAVSLGARIAGIGTVVVLAAQLAIVRPRLNRRSDAVLAGADAPRSHAHVAYIGLELVKVVGLVAAGVALLA